MNIEQTSTIRTELPLPPFALTFDLEWVGRTADRIEARMASGQISRLLVAGDPYHLHLVCDGQIARVPALLKTCLPDGDNLRLTFALQGDA